MSAELETHLQAVIASALLSIARAHNLQLIEALDTVPVDPQRISIAVVDQGANYSIKYGSRFGRTLEVNVVLHGNLQDQPAATFDAIAAEIDARFGELATGAFQIPPGPLAPFAYPVLSNYQPGSRTFDKTNLLKAYTITAHALLKSTYV